ncbi:MAG: ATP-grasp domain-containing protein [Lachnospiraceae bacterium]|nr:ATP-grasp domain-containing protein [Lachnospiraceae bacterium]
MARIMVIAGGDWQIELIKKAKKMGHYVICSNLYEDSPAFPYADACEVADVLDKEKNLEIAKKYMPDAVISDQSDIAVPTVAYLNEKLGLRGIGTALADLFTDKSAQRAFAAEHGLAIPEFRLCEKPEDAYPLLEKFGRIVIKPIDSQSSRGVYTIDNKEQLSEKVPESIGWSNRKKVFLAEEYIDGDEFTVDGLVVNGHHYPLCISVKEMYPQNPNISRTQSYSYHSQKHDYDLLRATNKALIELSGLPMGLTHSEYRAHKGKYYLVEAGARGGGSNLSGKIVPFMSGIDNYEYLIREALGEPVDEEKVKNNAFSEERYVVMRFFDLGEGVVERVEGLDFLKAHPMLIDWQLNVKPGDVLKQPAYGRLRPGHFIIGGDGKDKVEQEAARILEKVKVIFRQ